MLGSTAGPPHSPPPSTPGWMIVPMVFGASKGLVVLYSLNVLSAAACGRRRAPGGASVGGARIFQTPGLFLGCVSDSVAQAGPVGLARKPDLQRAGVVNHGRRKHRIMLPAFGYTTNAHVRKRAGRSRPCAESMRALMRAVSVSQSASTRSRKKATLEVRRELAGRYPSCDRFSGAKGETDRGAHRVRRAPRSTFRDRTLFGVGRGTTSSSLPSPYSPLSWERASSRPPFLAPPFSPRPFGGPHFSWPLSWGPPFSRPPFSALSFSLRLS